MTGLSEAAAALFGMAQGLRDIHAAIETVLKGWGEGHQFAIEDLRAALPPEFAGQGDLPRRLRDLRSWTGYKVPAKGKTYTIVSLKRGKKTANTDPVSGKLAAQVRLAAHGRCQMCGKTIADDGIKLVVDHRVPREWGGSSTDPDNLWAICEPCNIAKRDFFATLPVSVMSRCMSPKEPTERIGELLKAFEGKLCPRSLLEVVGRDDDWPRRLRELRDLGWKVEHCYDTTAKGKYRNAYKLTKWLPWPADIRQAIAEAAAKRGAKALH